MANEIRTSLGFEASQAIAELTRLQKELESYNTAMRAAAESTRAFNRAGRALDKVLSNTANNLNKLSAAARGVAAATQVNAATQGYSQIVAGAQGVIDVTGRLGTQAKSLAGTMNDTGQVAMRSFKTAGDAANILGIKIGDAGSKGAAAGKSVLLSWQSVVRIFAIQTIHRAITVLTNAFAEGISASVDYQIGLAEIQTIGEDLGMTTDELRESVRGISEEFAQPLDVVTKGLYETLSNQVAKGAENFVFLAAANKFAVAAVTDTASAVDLLSATLNSYNLSASDTEKVAGKLFRTIDLGRIRGEEFANTFGRVTVLSAQLGISLDEVLAAIATLTVTGLRYNEAFTLINNTTLKLIRPTDNLKAVFKDLGISSAEAGIQAYGFQGFLEKLTEVSGETATEIGELFNRVRAIRGVLGLTGNQAERFAENLKEIEKASDIDLQKAFETIFETDAKRFQKEMVSLKNVFIDTFGVNAVKTLNVFFGTFGGAPEAMGSFATAVLSAGVAYGLFSTGIITNNLRVIGSFAGFQLAASRALVTTRAFLATPLGAAIAIGTAILAASAAVNRYQEASKKAAEEQKKNDQIIVKSIQEREINRRGEVRKSEQEILSNIQKFIFEREKLYQQDAETAQRLQDAAFGSIADQVQDRLGAYTQFVQKIREHSEGARDAIKDLQNELLAAGDKLNEFNFERGLRGLSDQQKIWQLISESQQRVFESNQALASGDQVRANTLAQQAESLAKQALSTADSSNNSASIFKAENQVRSALAQQLQIRQWLLNEQKNAIGVSDKIRAEEEARKVRIDSLEKQLEKLNKVLEDEKLVPKFNETETRKQILNVGRQLQEELALAGKNAKILENYDPDIQKIREKFEAAFRDPLTGAKIDLVSILDINFSRILDILKSQADKIPEAKKIAIEKLTGTKIGIEGLATPSLELTKVDDDIQSAAKAVQDFSAAQLTLSNRLTDIRSKLVEAFGSAQQTGLRAFKTEGDGILGWANSMAGAALRVGPALAQVTGIMDNAVQLQVPERLQQWQTQIVEFGLAAEKALNPATFDPQRAADMANELAKLANVVQTAGFPQLSGQIRDAALAIQETITAARESAELKVVAETLTPLEQRVQEIGNQFNILSNEANVAGNEATTGSNSATNALNAQKQAVDTVTEAYRRQAEAARAAAQSGKGRLYGGMILKSLGGLIPKIDFRALGGPVGTDNILTALTAGESVNTANATRKFFPQIQAMNTGVSPQFRSDGGEVNNNFGDVNIEISESTNARETAREVMKQIKRESRRQTFNLRRS